MDHRFFLRIIYVVSVLVPVMVAFLVIVPSKLSFFGSWVSFLPGVHAVINSLTSVLLVLALIAIKRGDVSLHRWLMLVCFSLGVIFLLSYVLYHAHSDSVRYGDVDHDGLLSADELSIVGFSRHVYLALLLSHVLLSLVVVPFVLISLYYGLTRQIDRHKRVVRYTYPVWLYVSITGVLVYFMIKPYYFC